MNDGTLEEIVQDDDLSIDERTELLIENYCVYMELDKDEVLNCTNPYEECVYKNRDYCDHISLSHNRKYYYKR